MMIISRILCLALASAAAVGCCAASQIHWEGLRSVPVEVTPEASSGLDCVYVVATTAGASASFTAPEGTTQLTWSRYGSSGGAYAEPVEVERAGTTWTLRNVEPDTGYLIEYGDSRRYYFWVADWSATPFEPQSAEVTSTDCSSAIIRFSGRAERMTYYSINARPIEIDRGITISYRTMQWDEASGDYAVTDAEVTRAWLPDEITVMAPLCSTTFTISGDRFAAAWGTESAVTTATVDPVAIECHTEAVVTEREVDNEQKAEGAEIGGSAPVDVKFVASVTDAAIFTEWQMARDAEFDLIDYRSNDLEMDYTFRESGTTYVRFIAANNDATCEYTGDTYTVYVGESDLKIPNAFSPGASEGVNDVWKVSYKSIVEFECHIFNKWGVKMCELTDPSQGWDGKYNGKLVPAGVYYYVIKATGADGRNWDRAGDINILRYK